MDTQTITVNINLDALKGELQKSLQDVISLVATGLNAKSDIDPNDVELPTTMKSSFCKLDITKEQFSNRYNEWVLSNGFRDAIECASVFLESANRVLSIWKIIKSQNEGQPVTADDWNNIFLDSGNSFHRLGLPDKLEHIAKKHGIEVKNSLISQILSINIARNCYVHRRGVVSDRDANNDGELKVSWSSICPFIQDEDGEHSLVIGEVVKKDSVLCIRLEENEKLFPISSQLLFSVEEMSEIIWCIFLFGNELVTKISDYGVENELR